VKKKREERGRVFQVVIFAVVGMVGGLVRAVITGKGLIALPRVEEKDGHRFVNLGVIAPMIIGAFAGWLAPHSLGVNSIMAGLAGYVGADFIENLAETRIRGFPK